MAEHPRRPYPEADVRWRSVAGAYVAGVGVNAILPARGGDVLKLFLIHRRVEGSSYPTIAATLLVETLFCGERDPSERTLTIR